MRYVWAVELVGSLKRNDFKWENNIKISIKYLWNLAQNRCSTICCKRGNELNIIHLPCNDKCAAKFVNIFVLFKPYTSNSNIFRLTNVTTYMQYTQKVFLLLPRSLTQSKYLSTVQWILCCCSRRFIVEIRVFRAPIFHLLGNSQIYNLLMWTRNVIGVDILRLLN